MAKHFDNSTMSPLSRRLLKHALRHVTAQDVADFCPADPGYPDYVRKFTGIVETGLLPMVPKFNISETIGLTCWGNPELESDPVRFRRFRILTSAVGMAYWYDSQGYHEWMVPNYAAIRLIDDAYALNDNELLALLPDSFKEWHALLIEAEPEPEAPFLLLGQIILAIMGHPPAADPLPLAEQLVAEEAMHAGEVSPDFLWGCTRYDQLNSLWRQFVEQFFPVSSDHEAMMMVRKMLLSSCDKS